MTGGYKEGERAFFHQWLDVALDLGEVWVAEVDKRIEGVALWVKPGKDYTLMLVLSSCTSCPFLH